MFVHGMAADLEAVINAYYESDISVIKMIKFALKLPGNKRIC